MLSWLFHRGNDLTAQFLPDALFFKDSILSGKFPFWNPWIFAGMPHLLDPQNFLWYPPNYLLLLFHSVELGMLVLLVGHLMFAGYFMVKLLKTYPRWIQCFGIFLFLFSPKLVAHLEEGNWTLVIAATWLPALYWTLVNKRFWWMVVSLSALIINNLNIGYYSILFVLLWFLVQFFHNFRSTCAQFFRKNTSDRRSFFGKVALVTKMFLFTALLTIPRWFPLVLWGNQTIRANLQEAPLPFWSWTKIAKSLFVPLFPGHPELQNEEILYVGITPILLFIWIAIWKGLTLRTQGQTFWNFWNGWGLWVVFVSLVALNVKTPFYWFIEKLPGFSLFRITTRPWIFISLFVALTTPIVLFQLSGKSKLLAVVMALGVLGEFGVFGYTLFNRRVVPVDPLPRRFYEQMIEGGIPVRAYCTTGCIDRLTAQKMGIALLHGNNPIQLTTFVRYLEDAGGYKEPAYNPILPPYTVFAQKPQPSAELLGKTATRFVISPYDLADPQFELIDQEGEYRLYENRTDAMMEFSAHHFSLQISK